MVVKIPFLNTGISQRHRRLDEIPVASKAKYFFPAFVKAEAGLGMVW